MQIDIFPIRCNFIKDVMDTGNNLLSFWSIGMKSNVKLFYVVKKSFRPHMFLSPVSRRGLAKFSLTRGHILNAKAERQFVRVDDYYEPVDAVYSDLGSIDLNATFRSRQQSFSAHVWGPYGANAFSTEGLWYVSDTNPINAYMVGSQCLLDYDGMRQQLMCDDLAPARDGKKLFTFQGNEMMIVDPVDFASVLIEDPPM
jgi:hypothetical protein